MAGQKGRSVVIKISNSDSPETFTTIGGGQTDEITINEEPVDITDKDSSNRWREAIRGGVRSAEMSLDSVFKDSASEETLRANVMDTSDTVINFQFVVPDFGTFEGAFIVTNYTHRGENAGAAEFSATFSSAGELTFTAA